MIEELTTFMEQIPNHGLTALSGLGFALDQFARKQGLPTFAEWAASHFLQGKSIAGYVEAVDDLDAAEQQEPGVCATTFGYELSISVISTRDRGV
ncbi:UNVERIFIED_ORG: hypothetical protein J2W66_004349 [Agrobacterium larrymoorei]|uniref:Uncharacterized protein n=1 Tax=Agrobacterium cavarae TaxID=2528239 RepID=A0ABY1YB82_9HYPH|nr:hypothetical protein [Agrobacterium cavarae]MDP9573846.1 hypothetical protein [Agrobacterium larrymoorei]TBN14832.1 hypothetical protein EYC79_07310 [Agrobacterium cavarae]